MKHIGQLIAIVFILGIQVTYGQEAKSDSIAFKYNLDKFINRSFDSLKTDNLLLTIEARHGVKFDNLGSCLMLATVRILNEDELKHLNARVEEIAERFYTEGSPILISLGGSNSVYATNRLNQKGNKYNVTYVSLGNYCVVDKGEDEIEKVFNDRTMKLLGIDKIE